MAKTANLISKSPHVQKGPFGMWRRVGRVSASLPGRHFQIVSRPSHTDWRSGAVILYSFF
jgi:hypothetical protein